MEQSIESIEILTLETENHTVPSQQHSEAISWISDELKISQKKTLKKRERNICSVVHCRSYREANHWPEPLTFHEFPADLKRRELWLKAIGREDFIPGDKSKICAVHFTPESYRETPTAHLKRLTNLAIPSLRLQLEPLQKSQPIVTGSAGVQRTPNQIKTYPKTASVQALKKTQDQVKTYPNKSSAVQTVKKAQDAPVQIYRRIVPNTGQNSIKKTLEVHSLGPLLMNNSSVQVVNNLPAVVAKEVPHQQQYQVNNCAVKNCSLYRDAGRLSKNLSYHEIPDLDPEKRKLWLQALQIDDWNHKEKGIVCSMHFNLDDFKESNMKNMLEATAVPSVNLHLHENLTSEISLRYSEQFMKGVKIQGSRTDSVKRKLSTRDEDSTPDDSRARISTIVVVDMIKEKKTRVLTRSTTVTNDADACSTCLEMKKDLREVQFELAMVRKELEQQKKLVESLKQQLKNC